MSRGGNIFFGIALVVLMLACATPKVLAGSAFVGNQAGASRQSLELYGGYAEDFAIDVTTGTVYAGLNSPNGIFYLPSGGTDWVAPPAGSDFGSIIAVEVSDQANVAYILGGISLFKTINGGTSWTELAGSTGNVDHNNFAQTMLYTNGTLFVPVRDGNMDISTNEGASFTSVNIASTVTSITALAASSDGSSIYVLGTSDNPDSRTLYYSTNQGQTWQSTGVTGNYSKVAVKPTNANFVMLAGTGGITYTTGGATGTWTTVSTSPFYGTITFNGDRIYVSGSYSDDNGATWNTISSLSVEGGTTSPQKLIVDPADANTMYGSTSIGIAKTTDAAAHWTDLNTGLLGITVNDIAQTANKATVWLATIGGLARTNNFLDANVVWDFPILPNPSFGTANTVWIHPMDEHVILSSAGALSRSSDNGTTWTEVLTSSTPGNFTDIISNVDGSKIYVGFASQQGGGMVYESTDNGVVWTNLIAPDVAVNTLGLLSDGSIIAGVGTENDLTAAKRGLYHYTGSAWEQLNGAEGVMINDIEVAGDTIFVAGGSTEAGGVYRSTDNGVTWQDLTANGLDAMGWYHAVTVENTTAKVVYVSTGRPAGTGYVYKSLDEGDTWEKYYTGLVDEWFSVLFFDGLLSGTNTGLYDYRSKVSLTLKSTANIVTATLKDKATQQGLRRQTVKLFTKTAGGKFTLFKAIKTNKRGKAEFTITASGTIVAQARWKPTKTAKASYGSKVKKSKTITVLF